MMNKSHHEAVRYQAIAAERANRIEELKEEMALQKLEYAVLLMQAANKIASLQRSANM